MKDEKNQKTIDDYDYLSNAASKQDCTGLIPSEPISIEELDVHFIHLPHFLYYLEGPALTQVLFHQFFCQFWHLQINQDLFHLFPNRIWHLGNGLFALHNQGSIDNCHHFHLLPKDYFGNKKQDILNQCPEFSDHLHHPEVAELLP